MEVKDPIQDVLDGDDYTPVNPVPAVVAEVLPPRPRGDIVDERDPAIIQRDRNFQDVKNNIKDMMPAIAEAASDTLAIAKMLSSADHASAGASLLGTYLQAQKALVAVEKTHDDLRHRDKKAAEGREDAPAGTTNQTVNIFAGTTSDLLDALDAMKKSKKIGV